MPIGIWLLDRNEIEDGANEQSSTESKPNLPSLLSNSKAAEAEENKIEDIEIARSCP